MLKGCERMANKSFTMEIKDLQKVIDKFGNIDKNGRKAVKATVKDVRARAPSWVAQEVTKVYTIPISEVRPATKKDMENNVKKAGSIKVRGETLERMQITYTGRRLTPIHFKMKPTEPSELLKSYDAVPSAGIQISGNRKAKVAMVHQRKPYDITLTIKRGQTKALRGKYDTPPFLARVSKTSSKLIPFQRKGKDRNAITAIHSTSLPQMISSNEDVKTAIENRLRDELEKRLAHNIKRFVKK